MVSLLHPGLLPWLLAASVPIVIHLLTRRTRRRLDLPTVKFLQKAMAQQSDVFRWRHLLLMLLRTLAILALVAAFTKPTLNSPLAAQTNDRSSVVLILDTSASMGYVDGGASTLSRAKSDAVKVLSSLRDSVKVNVILCDAHPQSVASALTTDFPALERSLRDAKPSQERANPNAAINMAVEQLGKSGAKSKQIYVFSDFQRGNWADVKFESVPADTKMAFVGAASDRRANVGITSIRLSPTAPRIGEPVAVECEVFNSGDSLRTLPVNLSVSTGERQTQNVSLAPFSSATASFTLQFDSPKQIECVASIPADNLPLDDSRRVVIDLKKTAVVLVITDEDPKKAPNSTFFLTHALHPGAAAQSGVQIITVKPAALNNPTLHSADAVIVCNAPQMPDVQFQALSRYASGGGNLIWFLYGDKIADQMTKLGRQLPATEPMPLQIDHVADLSGNGKGYVTLAEAHYESPLLKAFKDPAAADLSKIQFRKICVTGEVDPRAETLLKFDDGTCAVAHTIEGSGNLLLVNMSPDPTWSDLARQPAFLPLLHEFLKGLLSHNTAAAEFVAGGSASSTVAANSLGQGAKISCSGPMGLLPVSSDPVTGSIVVDNVPQSGFYHIAAGQNQVASLAVNVHSDESDLRTIDPRELETQQRRESSYFAGMGKADSDLDSLSKGRPLWQYLLAFALLCLFGEQAVSRVTAKGRKK
jgi:hypothetical protein